MDGGEVHQWLLQPAAQAAAAHGREGLVDGPEQRSLQLSVPLGGCELQVAAGLGVEHQRLAAVHDPGHIQRDSGVVFQGLGLVDVLQQPSEGPQGQG